MALEFNPRVETIVVPEYVPANRIGAYATHCANEFLMQAGTANINRVSVSLKPISDRLFALSFQSSSTYSLPREELDRYNSEAYAKNKREEIQRQVAQGSSGSKSEEVATESTSVVRKLEEESRSVGILPHGLQEATSRTNPTRTTTKR